ncbi:hypothetical protein SHKM778_41090 [Streptomyces sp. KM77-8]|uniref:PAS domain-containing protein n=1 Tax=Streptomyces haneummycinicus TaxID=3074435 RepID=A0AAT9HK69_9ACTN
MPAGCLITAERPGVETSPAGRAFQQATLAMSVLDTRQRFVRLNDAACAAMGRPEEELAGRTLKEAAWCSEHTRRIERELRRVAETGEPVHHESCGRAPSASRLHAWNVEMWPVRDVAGTVVGTAMTGFDSTEQYHARRRLGLLNEAATAIGTTLDVVRTAEELVEFLVPEIADFAAVDLLDWVLGADEPRTGPAPEWCCAVRRTPSPPPRARPRPPCPSDGRTSARPSPRPRGHCGRAGRCSPRPANRMSHGGWPNGAFPPRTAAPASTPSGGSAARPRHHARRRARRPQHPARGYADDDAVLAEELASRAAVCVDNARRFARERTTALALQHSLLPTGLPGQAAVEVAHRYLPSASAAGIGGDWFDVIPLAGSRVALVVGDVVGHGIPPRPPWAGSAWPCAPSPTWTSVPTNSSPTSTTWSPIWPPTTAWTSPNSAPPVCTPSTTRSPACWPWPPPAIPRPPSCCPTGRAG